ncbi:MAG: hypothetical protein J6U93_03820 [Alistipes sp.]|nr:hypothetical protein [Alistipes sp.]
MRRLCMLLVALMCAVNVSAQITARDWIEGLNYTLDDRYALYMKVGAYGEEMNGYFMVDKDSYYIQLGIMEVYSDGKLRYEINNERKEVTEDRVNLDSRDLLTNPTRAFEFLESEFTATISETIHNGAILKLVPKQSADITAVYVSVVWKDNRIIPLAIKYDYDGEEVTIALVMADVNSAILPRWNKSAYKTYDIVSFL